LRGKRKSDIARSDPIIYVTIKGEKWLGLEDESGTKLVEEISSERFNLKPPNKFVERTMNFPGDNYKYEFANEGKEFRLYLPRNREEAFKAVPWQNIIDYREAHGEFKAPEEIKLVDGIDDKKWNKWKKEGWVIKIK